MKKTSRNLACLLILCCLFFKTDVFAAKELNIAFVGLFGSGKTALRARTTGKFFNFDKRDATQKTDVFDEVLRYYDKNIKCNLFDTSGDEDIRNAIIAHRLNGVDMVVITIDSSKDFNKVYRENFTKWIDTINKSYPSLPVILAATKIDEGVTLTQMRSKLNSMRDAFSDTCDFEYVMVSAKRETNLGDINASDDLGENFWGRVRYMIQQRNMYDKLNESKVKVFEKGKDDAAYAKEKGKCTLF